MGTYWGYTRRDHMWYACYYIEGKAKVKLGPFYTQEEVMEAAEKHDAPKKDTNK
jgi:hypothetical protein